jgi:hypothetical protein
MSKRQAAIVRGTDHLNPSVLRNCSDALHVPLLRRYVCRSRAVCLHSGKAGESPAFNKRVEHRCVPLLARKPRGRATGVVRCGEALARAMLVQSSQEFDLAILRRTKRRSKTRISSICL